MGLCTYIIPMADRDGAWLRARAAQLRQGLPARALAPLELFAKIHMNCFVLMGEFLGALRLVCMRRISCYFTDLLTAANPTAHNIWRIVMPDPFKILRGASRADLVLFNKTGRLVFRSGIARKIVLERCLDAQLASAKWLVARFHLWGAAIGELQVVCLGGNLRESKWLATRLVYPISATELQIICTNILVPVCGKGWLEMVKWLVVKFNLTQIFLQQRFTTVGMYVGSMTPADAKTVIRAMYVAAMCAAARGAHLSVMRWLVRVAGFKADIARPTAHPTEADCSLLRNACYSGNLPCVRWVITKFQLTADDVVADALCMYDASFGGYLPIVEWLVNNYNFNRNTLFSAFFTAQSRGKIDVATWLRRKLLLSAQGINEYLAVVRECPLQSICN